MASYLGCSLQPESEELRGTGGGSECCVLRDAGSSVRLGRRVPQGRRVRRPEVSKDEIAESLVNHVRGSRVSLGAL